MSKGLGVDGALAIQTEKTQSYDEPIGGMAEVTMADGAALCAGIPEKHYKAMRLVEMQDRSVMEWVRIELWRFAMELSYQQKWRGGKVPRGSGEHKAPRALADMVILEVLEPARFARQDSWQVKAAMLEVKKAAWFETWKPRYDEVFMRLMMWVDSGRNQLKRKCKQNSNDDCLT